ncbi:putative gustatory receptor 28a isoform X3 [Zootermopsis nevadensis]|uniref:putative gustatory receptor 28a isoform X3 n=1 Tax=Zootermopsis nevadensis TaxID=136037 RepID=UPI000B8E3922|nr:putative gustatory receptor 28a isoform X3 [Zootermopsis nevadensis]
MLVSPIRGNTESDKGQYSDDVWEWVMTGMLGWYVLKLGGIVWACASTAREANRTAVLVHKLLSKTRDPGVKEELQLFSLQLLHRKVQFTACGFFPLDFTLLYSIIGAVTTYLVILIQFQLSFANPKQNGTVSAVLPVSTSSDLFTPTLPP